VVQTAQCPLCATAFEVNSAPIPLVATPSVRRVDEIIRPFPTEIPEQQGWSPGGESEESQPDFEIRRTITSCARWLKAAALLGFVQLFSCGCCDLFESNFHRSVLFESFGESYIWVQWLVRLIALAYIHITADMFSRRHGLRAVRIGAGVALLLGLYMMYRTYPWMVYFLEKVSGPRGIGGEELLTLWIGLFACAVGATCIVGSIKTFILLSRPDVRAACAR
jgi:hypothetical protein